MVRSGFIERHSTGLVETPYGLCEPAPLREVVTLLRRDQLAARRLLDGSHRLAPEVQPLYKAKGHAAQGRGRIPATSGSSSR
ncbi:hypothetical protein GCM10010486_05410 [Nonomuraea roseoviolacea subsp. carminata]